jgi:hypothetical protein
MRSDGRGNFTAILAKGEPNFAAWCALEPFMFWRKRSLRRGCRLGILLG